MKKSERLTTRVQHLLTSHNTLPSLNPRWISHNEFEWQNRLDRLKMWLEDARARAQTSKHHIQEYNVGKYSSQKGNPQSADDVLDLPRE